MNLGGASLLPAQFIEVVHFLRQELEAAGANISSK
jgi:hypothetical protein